MSTETRSLIGTTWKHRKKAGIYRITALDEKKQEAYLSAQSKGCRSTWKYIPLLSFDYEQITSQ